MTFREWTADELRRHLAEDQPPPLVVDVRGEAEFLLGTFPGAQNVPLDLLDEQKDELPRDRDLVCVCPDGERSAVAVAILADLGFDRGVILTGGLLALGITVGPGPTAEDIGDPWGELPPLTERLDGA